MFYKETNFRETPPIGKIPRDWKVVRLRDVLLLLRNGLTAKQNKEGNGYPVTRIETISEEKIDPSKLGYMFEVPEKDMEEYRLIEGDILFSHINSLEHIGKTAIYEGVPDFLLHGMNLLLLRPDKNKIYPKFLLYLLRLFRGRKVFWAMSKKAVNQASINQTELGNLQIFLPLMKEQQKIASILSTVDEAIQKTNEIIAKTERLKKGLMQELLTKGIGHKEFKDTEIGRIPKEWEVVKLGDVVTYRKGVKPKVVFDQREPNTLPYLTADDVRAGIFTKWAKESDKTIKVNKDDVILIWDGFYCGDAFMGLEGILSSTMIKIEPKSNLNGRFLFYILKTHFKELNTKISGMYLKHVNKSVFENLKLPLPPPQEQQKIVEILSTIDKKLDIEKNQKVKLKNIKQGLMDLLLTGKVRVKVI
jgi:type I restriction enzyme S subunit